ncbi:hypothetical protein JCM17380_49660 [Desulfosporosinus burensis]
MELREFLLEPLNNRHCLPIKTKIVKLSLGKSTIQDQQSSPFDENTKHPCVDTS